MSLYLATFNQPRSLCPATPAAHAFRSERARCCQLNSPPQQIKMDERGRASFWFSAALCLAPLCLASSAQADAFRCPSDGHFADENDCTKYYHCANGRSNPGYCPSGLFWDNGGFNMFKCMQHQKGLSNPLRFFVGTP